jgi:transcriptional regulator with XRE-family HTH domain
MITRYETEGAIPPAERLQALVDALQIPVARLFEHAAELLDPKTDLTGIDARSVKKLRDILSLSVEDRNDLYRILNKLVRKQQAEQGGTRRSLNVGVGETTAPTRATLKRRQHSWRDGLNWGV